MNNLSEYYGDDLFILSGSGVDSLILLRSKKSMLLKLVSVDEDDELERSIPTVTKSMLTETKQLKSTNQLTISGYPIRVLHKM